VGSFGDFWLEAGVNGVKFCEGRIYFDSLGFWLDLPGFLAETQKAETAEHGARPDKREGRRKIKNVFLHVFLCVLPCCGDFRRRELKFGKQKAELTGGHGTNGTNGTDVGAETGKQGRRPRDQQTTGGGWTIEDGR
jgi:hypothetical protein